MGKGKSRVSVIIPNYNGKEHLKRLLPSIANQTFHDYEVIVIDDSSPDRSVLKYIGTFAQAHDRMRLVENPNNIGFVKTCNKGIRLSEGEYICILTNDTEVDSRFIEKHVEIMDAGSSIGILSCIIVDEDGNNWLYGGNLQAGVPVHLRDDFQGVRAVDFAAGTACFYRRDLFDKVGLLNEDFVMYHEDVEFCLRVRNQTDYEVRVFDGKLVTHYAKPPWPGSRNLANACRASYYLHRNHILLLRSYFPEYIPKVLLSDLGEIIYLPIIALFRRRPASFLSSFVLIVLVIAGALAGLTKRQSR